MGKYRYTRVPGGDNSDLFITKQIQNPAYATPTALANLDCEENIIDFAQLTGALTVTADVVNPYVGDKLTCLFKADSSSDRVVTFSTGFTANSTLTVADTMPAVVTFIFTGSVWLEVSRFAPAD